MNRQQGGGDQRVTEHRRGPPEESTAPTMGRGTLHSLPLDIALAAGGWVRQGCTEGCAGEVCAPGKVQGVGWRPAVVLAAGRREGDRFRFRFRFRINLRI